MFPSSSIPVSTSTNVFENGKYKTELINVRERSSWFSTKANSSQCSPPPKPLLIETPSEAGEFPVLLFLHGYLLSNSFYSQLLQHIASHGFIVIAPQLYTVAGPDSTEEIKSTAEITNWFSEGLQSYLPSHIRPNLLKLALSGHSRGGKVAFAVALRKALTSLKFSALIGVDPVDGMDDGEQTPPPTLTYVPRCFDIDMAVLVIGSGLGEVKRNPSAPSAPKGVKHEDFYNECREPAYYFVAKDYGHVDMLNDDTNLLLECFTNLFCKHGESREPMRRFVGGVMVAFLRAYLEDKSMDLESIKVGHLAAPVVLQKVDFLV
ncbi:hypothetical protein ACH5RR_033214 [Cinchona calisaya]|uniref:Chlorophyllase n=1 Tax=Cinchona calisaya TaxID=153742 RepID=A0ABD2YNG2_9GENT